MTGTVEIEAESGQSVAAAIVGLLQGFFYLYFWARR